MSKIWSILFHMHFFRVNHTIDSQSEIFDRITESALLIFSRLWEEMLSIINRCGKDAHASDSKTPQKKVNWVQIRRGWLPQIFFSKLWKMVSHHFWVYFEMVAGVPFCWKINGTYTKCFLTWLSAGVKMSWI